jgi:hypothetical protein
VNYIGAEYLIKKELDGDMHIYSLIENRKITDEDTKQPTYLEAFFFLDSYEKNRRIKPV